MDKFSISVACNVALLTTLFLICLTFYCDHRDLEHHITTIHKSLDKMYEKEKNMGYQFNF